MTPRSLKVRLLVLGAASIGMALLLAGLGIVWLFERHVERRAEAELDTYVRQIAAGISFDAGGAFSFNGTLPDPRFGEPQSGLYWQIEDEGKGQLLRSRSLWDFVLAPPEDALDTGSVHRHMLAGPAHARLLTRERSVAYPEPGGSKRLRISVALDTREIKAARAAFSRDVLAALALLGIALMAAAWAQIAFGLRPLKVLRQSVLAVRSGTKPRIDVAEPSEIMPLVSAVNSLLEAQAAAIENAKARAADLAHGLKTPLTVLMADAAKLRENGAPELAAEIEELANTMRRHVDRELSRARLQAASSLKFPRTLIEPIVAKLVHTLGRTAKGESLEWHIRIGEDAVAPVGGEDLAELLGNLLENACKWATSAVAISAEAEGGVTIAVADDGPGAPSSLIHRLGERGVRLDQQISGSGLGLAIAHDIVRTYGGSLTFSNVEPHGFRAAVCFPFQSADRPPAQRGQSGKPFTMAAQ